MADRVVYKGSAKHRFGAFQGEVGDQARSSNHQADELREAWERIQISIQDSEEFEWCRNAGRLALDPYDPDILDLSRLSAGISESLFEDICDAAEIGELQRTCDWVRGASSRLQYAQPISLHSFGAPPLRDLKLPGFKHGYEAAEMLRMRLKLPKDPVKAVDQVLQGADKTDRGSFVDNSPDIIEGVVRRQKTEFHAAVPSRSVRQRRFRMCRATYLAWRASSDTEVAATPAETFRQQASRSFAAELVAPAFLIKERFGRTGLTPLAVERLASEWQCPPRTIVHQAQNNGVAVKGIEPAAYY